MLIKSSRALFTGVALVGVTTLGLFSGSARAQSFPCAINSPDPLLVPECAIGAFGPVGDKTIELMSVPNDNSLVSFTQSGSSYDFTVAYETGQYLLDTINYYITIDPAADQAFNTVSLSSTITPGALGSAYVSKAIYAEDRNVDPNSILFGTILNSGTISIPQGTTKLFIVDEVFSEDDYLIVDFTNSYTQYSTAQTPSPLPLFGASAAFGFSRRLRRRTLQASFLR
jgi:hypothetical protein